MGTSEIVVGDCVVVGRTREERDCGRIEALDGDMATIAWGAGGTDVVDLTREDVEVYDSMTRARARETELDASEEGES